MWPNLQEIADVVTFIEGMLPQGTSMFRVCKVYITKVIQIADILKVMQ